MNQKVQNIRMVSISVSVCVCACVCVYQYLCVSGMPNIKLVSLAFYAKLAKKCKMQKLYLSVCACACVYLHFCVCGVPFINLVSLAFLPNEPKSAKCKFKKKFITLRISLINS